MLPCRTTSSVGALANWIFSQWLFITFRVNAAFTPAHAIIRSITNVAVATKTRLVEQLSCAAIPEIVAPEISRLTNANVFFTNVVRTLAFLACNLVQRAYWVICTKRSNFSCQLEATHPGMTIFVTAGAYLHNWLVAARASRHIRAFIVTNFVAFTQLFITPAVYSIHLLTIGIITVW